MLVGLFKFYSFIYFRGFRPFVLFLFLSVFIFLVVVGRRLSSDLGESRLNAGKGNTSFCQYSICCLMVIWLKVLKRL